MDNQPKQQLHIEYPCSRPFRILTQSMMDDDLAALYPPIANVYSLPITS